MIDKAKAVRLGIEAGSMLYDPARKDCTQLEFIYELAQIAPDGTGIEVGVKCGGTVVTWGLARIGRGKVIAIDNRRTENYETALIEKLVDYGIEATLLEVNSWDAPEFIDGRVAFCFVDADHSYKCISRDIAVWPDKIQPSGILVFHDYGVWKPNVAVKQVVDEWQERAQWEQIGIVGALIAFRRPN